VARTVADYELQSLLGRGGFGEDPSRCASAPALADDLERFVTPGNMRVTSRTTPDSRIPCTGA